MRPRDKFTDEAFDQDWDECIASQFGCDPDRIFDERRRDTPGGTLYAWKADMSLLLSGHDFARLVLAPLEQAMNELALSNG